MADIVVYPLPEFLTAFGVSRRKVYEALNSGQLKARKNGKRTMIIAADALAWLDSLPAYEPRDRHSGPFDLSRD